MCRQNNDDNNNTDNNIILSFSVFYSGLKLRSIHQYEEIDVIDINYT